MTGTEIAWAELGKRGTRVLRSKPEGWPVASDVRLSTALVTTLAVAAALGVAATVPRAESERGATVYAERGCRVCHGAQREGTRMGPSLLDIERHWNRKTLRSYLANPDSARRADERLRRVDSKYRRFEMPAYSFDDPTYAALAGFLLGRD